jgi:hypothetical protein
MAVDKWNETLLSFSERIYLFVKCSAGIESFLKEIFAEAKFNIFDTV